MGSIAAEQARGRGHTVYYARFEEAELPAHHFDIIISLHVIEHVARPDLFLEKCRDVLAKDGLILIETPNTDCLDFRFLQGHHWGGYHAPRHWYLFRRETFTVLADRLNLRIKASSPYPVSVFWNWTCHSLMQSALGRRIADVLFPPVTIFYGGLRSLFILGTFSVLEGLQMRLTGKANGLWIVFSPASDAAA
jgi:SAM-dependent methyltransferase